MAKASVIEAQKAEALALIADQMKQMEVVAAQNERIEAKLDEVLAKLNPVKPVEGEAESKSKLPDAKAFKEGKV
jgi:cell shape-determining protein MreC